MGGSSKTEDKQQQQQTQPWEPAQPLLGGILGKLSGSLQNSDLTNAENGALSGMEGNAGFLNQFTPQLHSYANDLLSGGGAQNQAGMIGDAYKNYQQQLSPYLQAGYTDPRNTPGFSDALNAMNSDISGQVNGMFAGAGRDLSGMNVQTLARGLSQGEGGLIANQYNQNVANQLGAAGSLYGAGNTTGGLLSGLNQQRLANMGAGAGAANMAQDFSNSGYQNVLAAEAARRGIPLSYLQQITGMGTGIAGLGSQSQGQSKTQTKTTPGVYDWAGLAPKLFGGHQG